MRAHLWNTLYCNQATKVEIVKKDNYTKAFYEE